MPILSRHNVNLSQRELHAALPGCHEPDETLVDAFESAFATYHGVRHAVATGTGRAALFLALKSLKLPPGAPVAMPGYTFYTLPAVVEALGLQPVYVPVNPRTFAIDETRLEENLPRDTAALLVIHPFGQAAPLDPILEICRRRSIPLLEDPSQSIGGRYNDKGLGSFGHASAFSLVPGKNMTACGGGMLTTDDDALAEQARDLLREAPTPTGAMGRVLSTGVQWAMTHRVGFALGLYYPFRILNRLDRNRLDAIFEEAQIPFHTHQDLTRLSGVQAAIGQVQLERLDELNAIRRRNAEALLSALAGIPELTLPQVVDKCEPTFNAVAVRVAHAARIRQLLLKKGIDSREDYMRWAEDGLQKRDEILYLPNHPGLNLNHMRYVADTTRRIVHGRP